MSDDNVIPLRPYQDALIAKLKSDASKKLPVGLLPNLSQMLEGGFRRGELYVQGTAHFRPAMSPGLKALFEGKDDVVLGPEDHHQLFSGKSLLTWHLIMSNPVLRERYLKATHIAFDLEAPAFDTVNIKSYQDCKTMFEVDSCPDWLTGPPKDSPVKLKSKPMNPPEKTKITTVISAIFPEPKADE